MTRDPYAAPEVGPDALERPGPPRDLRWRGAVWFAAPLLALLALGTAYDLLFLEITGNMKIALAVVPMALLAAGVGFVCGRRCRGSSWWRYLVVTIVAALAWAIVATLVLFAYAYLLQVRSPNVGAFGRMSLLTVPLSLILATTFRLFHRRR